MPDDDVLGEPDAPAPPADSGERPRWLWYVYGIQRASADPPQDVAGVVGATVDDVEAAGLRAIVSKVRSTDLGQPALGEHLDDLEWVGTNAHAHAAVLAVALAAGPVLPLRFGTVFAGHEAVVEVLQRHAGELDAELSRLTGRHEWGAKVLADIEACDRWIAERSPGAAQAASETAIGRIAGDGHAYLARRQAQRATRDERHRLLLEISGDVHARLADLAVDSRTDPPQPRHLSGHEGEMILNGAYLLDDTTISALQQAASELTERHSDKGVVVQVTGPWPPHHFLSLPPLGEVGTSA